MGTVEVSVLIKLPSIQALSKTVWIPMNYMCGA